MELILKVGGDTFVFSPINGMRSFILQPVILPVIAEVFGAISQIAVDGKLDLQNFDLATVDVEKLLPLMAPLVARICDKLPPERLEYITRELLRPVVVGGRPLFSSDGSTDLFDGMMQSRTMDAWKLVIHAVRLNYSDFLGALAARKGPAAVEGDPSKASNI